MFYINIDTNEYPLSEQEIKSLFPNTTFPNAFIPPSNYKFVASTSKPDYNPIIQKVQRKAPVLTELGTYEESWEVIELFDKVPDRNAAIAAAQRELDIAENAKIDAELLQNDLKIIRALVENDIPTINSHKASQAILRAKRKPL